MMRRGTGIEAHSVKEVFNGLTGDAACYHMASTSLTVIVAFHTLHSIGVRVVSKRARVKALISIPLLSLNDCSLLNEEWVSAGATCYTGSQKDLLSSVCAN